MEREKEIFKEKWKERRTETIADINDPLVRRRIKGEVKGLKSMVFVKVAGLLASIGQLALADLTGEMSASKEFGGIPVVYIDSMHCNTPDRCVQRHKIDEILQWEHLRVHVLKIDTKKGMRSWIRKHLNSSDERLNGTVCEGMNSRQIAKLFCGYSYSLRRLYEKIKDTTCFDYEYILDMLLAYGIDEKSGDVNIAAHTKDEEATGIRKAIELSGKNKIDEFRSFAERRPPIGAQAEMTLKLRGTHATFVKSAFAVSLQEYKGKTVRFVERRVADDLIAITMYDARTDEILWEGSYLYSYNQDRPSCERKILKLRDHYRLWFMKGTETPPDRLLELTYLSNTACYVFVVDDPKKKGHHIVAWIWIPVGYSNLPDGKKRERFYGRVAEENGERIIYVFVDSAHKDPGQSIGGYRFEPPNKFIQCREDRTGGIYRLDKPRKRMVIVPKRGSSGWYRDIALGSTVSRQRLELMKNVSPHRRIYMWSMGSKVDGDFLILCPAVGYDFKIGDIVWYNNVPEESERIEYIKEEGVSSLDSPAHYREKIVRLFFDRDKRDFNTAKEEMVKRSNLFFAAKGHIKAPDPVVVRSRREGSILVSEIDGVKSCMRSSIHWNEDILFDYGEDQEGRRYIRAYLLDEDARPYARFREGRFDPETKEVVWKGQRSIKYLDEAEREEIAAKMWRMGYSSAPDFVADFMKYIADNAERFHPYKGTESDMLYQIARRIKGKKRIAIEELLASLPLDESMRRTKETIIMLARQPETNPNYRPNERWESAAGLSASDIVKRTGISAYLERCHTDQRPLDEVLLACQKALYVETIRLVNGREKEAGMILHPVLFRRRARGYGINTKDPVWASDGARSITGMNLRLPEAGIPMHNFVNAIRDIYVSMALDSCGGDQAIVRQRLKASIWEFNHVMGMLGIAPSEKEPRLVGEALVERHLDSLKRYERNPYGFDIIAAKKYLRNRFAIEDPESLARMLVVTRSDEETAERNIALIRAITFLFKKDRMKVEKYIVPFYSYPCTETIRLRLKAALDDYIASIKGPRAVPVKAAEPPVKAVEAKPAEEAKAPVETEAPKRKLQEMLRGDIAKRIGQIRDMRLSSVGKKELRKVLDELREIEKEIVGRIRTNRDKAREKFMDPRIQQLYANRVTGYERILGIARDRIARFDTAIEGGGEIDEADEEESTDEEDEGYGDEGDPYSGGLTDDDTNGGLGGGLAGRAELQVFSPLELIGGQSPMPGALSRRHRSHNPRGRFIANMVGPDGRPTHVIVIGPRAEQSTKGAVVLPDYMSQAPLDIENALHVMNELIPAQLEKGRVYEVRYDRARLSANDQAGIGNESPAEALFNEYIACLRMRVREGDPNDVIKSIDHPGKGEHDEALFSVTCYEDSSKRKTVGESSISVEGAIEGQPLRVVGMLNMAFAASHIPNDTSREDLSNYGPIVTYITKQYKELTGSDSLPDIWRITLPRAAPIPVEALQEHYRLIVIQLQQAA